MTTIVNVLAGPGCGKSTIAAKLFAALKCEHRSVELCSEYVKSWVWEERRPVDFDQFYFFGKQARREHSLFGKVDFIVTDAPVLLTSYYAQVFGTPEQAVLFRSMILTYLGMCREHGHIQKNYFLTRTHPYDTTGRFQSEDQAKQIDEELRRYLKELGLPVLDVPASDEGVAQIIASLGGK